MVLNMAHGKNIMTLAGRQKTGGWNESALYAWKAVPETGHEISRVIKRRTRCGIGAKETTA
jgi:hypothetical protein